VIVGAVLLLLFKVADWAARRSGPLPVLPSPNGYDPLLAIADKVKRPPGELADLSPEFTARYQETTRRTRRLMLVLAARTAELETGRRVGRLSDLVPGVLQAVPLDPVSSTPFTELPAAANDP
jgi:hypothetical protein